jgi:hypothetical protein
MRHLRPRRLPPFSHDRTSTSFHLVRPLSATSSEVGVGWTAPNGSTPSSLNAGASEKTGASSLLFTRPFSIPMNPMLFSRLSRRQMRQREQKWGVLWRYRPDSYPLSHTRPTPLPVTSQLYHSDVCDGVASTSSSTVHRVTLPLLLPVQPQAGKELRDGESTPFQVKTASHQNSAVLSTVRSTFHERPALELRSTQKKMESGTAVPSTSPSSSTTREGATPPPSPEHDPLLDFLDAHEEDAADLLVMWTSLHRSCVYASELSEMVVLQVRYFFHSLLHNRAIAAAMAFYYRLMGLGVQLQQSDLLLLLSSLPYENATTEAEQLRMAQERAIMEQDRVTWARRRQEFKEAAQRTQASAHAAAHAVSGKGEAEGERAMKDTTAESLVDAATAAVGVAAVEGKSEKLTTPLPPRVGMAREGEAEAHLPSTIARKVAFSHQPEWVKRWILYEASMGMLDGLDSQEGASPPTTAGQGTSSAGSTGAVPSADVAASPFSSVTNSVEASRQSEKASRVMELAAIVDHLRLLTLGAMQRDDSALRLRARHAGAQRAGTARALSAIRCAARSAAEKLYWREALRVVRNAFATPLWSAPLSSSSTAEPLALSGDVATTLQCMMRDAHTWEGALALLQLKAMPVFSGPRQLQREVSMGRAEFRSGAVLFTALAAAAQPWKTQASVEEWMHGCMLPHLADQLRISDGGMASTDPIAGAVTAIYALWLSHLCGVKAARPEQFITMVEEVAQYLPAPNSHDTPVITEDAAAHARRADTTTTTAAAAQLLHADLSVMVSEVEARAEEAVAGFRRGVYASMLSRRASEALAKSVQLGTYRLDVEGEESSGNDGQRHERCLRDLPAAVATLPTPASAAYASGPSLLSDAQVDAFVLCCAAIKEATWLRFTTAAVQDLASVTAALLQFLERSLYGRTGLHALYNELYGGSVTSLHRGNDEAHGEGVFASSRAELNAAAAAAPEGPFVSVVLATTLQRVAKLFCVSASQQPQRRFGSQLCHRDTLHLLVGLSRRTLDGVRPAHIRVAPWRWATEARVAELVTATAQTLHAVIRELDVQPGNEKVMFGAVADRDLRLLAELARLLITTSDLAATTSGDKPGAALPVCSAAVRCPVWRLLTETASPHVLRGVQLCFRQCSALGRRVRHLLTRHEAERLDALLGSSRAHCSVVKRKGTTARPAVLERMRCLNDGLVPCVRVTDGDFVLARTVRDSVYTAVTSEATSAGVGAALQRLAATTTSWVTSLQLCQLATRDVALARGTCGMPFFTTVLTKMTSDLVESRMKAVASRSGKGGLNSLRSQWRGGRNAGTILAASTVTVGPPSLWLSAIDVFWSAVDHTAGTPAAPAEHLGVSSEDIWGNRQNNTALSAIGQAQERAVLAELLLPLIDFSRTIGRADLGRQWRRTWSAKYSSTEKQSLPFRRQNILALSALNDNAALERCIAGYAQLGHDDELLCRVAVQHHNWQRALQAVEQVYGAMEERAQAQSPYPLMVAHTILALLHRSPRNLSNTAMRLETLQGGEWDAECSAQVVQLLLRARRWSLALQHVEAALTGQPRLQRVHAAVTSEVVSDSPSNARTSSESSVTCPPSRALVLTPQEALPYVSLLTLALHATAIGGDSATAPVYYEALKRAMQAVFEPLQHRHDAPRSGAAGRELDTVFEMASAATATPPDASPAHATAEEKRSRAELRELSARARLLFFRAMTKKLMSPKENNAVDQCNPEVHDDGVADGGCDVAGRSTAF